MSKIKLNAESGGGSVSIQAPSSSSNNRVLTLPDVADSTILTSESTLNSTKLSPAITSNTGGMQVLEQFLCPCDGSVITLGDGDHTIASVTTVQGLSTTFTDLGGSSITYTPPTGTKQVIYEFVLHVATADAHGIGTIRTYLDNVEVTGAVFAFGADKHYDARVCHRWSFNIGGTADASTGRVASWTSAKTIKLKGRDYSNSNDAKVFQTRFHDGSLSGTFSRPCLGITSIGSL